MPRESHDRLLIAAGQFFGHESSAPLEAAKTELAPTRIETRSTAGRPTIGSRSSFSWLEAIALTVTAACLILMLSGLNPFARDPANIEQVAGLRTPAERMKSFVDAKPADLVDLVWQPVHQPNAKGNILWSDSLQEGYMKFEGLTVNDPTKAQYQLWIFNTDKEQLHPVDGGVFDSTSTDEFVIPIKAHVPVDKAVQFVVTVERPGGVTVSDRVSIPVLAAIPDT